MAFPHMSWPAADEVAHLVADAQSGSDQAVDVLLSTLRPYLVNFFARRLSPEVAEDLAQIGLIRITRALPSIEPARADRFIVTVACNLLRTAFSQRARDQLRWAPAELAEGMAATSAADRHAEYNELAHAVSQILQSGLPPALRDVMLGVLQDETPTEIAARLGLNPVTVRTRLMRARAILRKELGRHLDPEDDPAIRKTSVDESKNE